MKEMTRIARSTLACVTLVASLGLLSSCNTLEELDKDSDKVLNKLNEPGGSPSSSWSTGQSERRSGLNVVPRKAMPQQTLKDKNGRRVELWGQSSSASTTPGHRETIDKKARSMAESGKYEYITMQRSWRTATGRVSESRKIPDIIGVRRDGKVDAVEVMSASDDEETLEKRLIDGLNTLPAKRRGQYEVIKSRR